MAWLEIYDLNISIECQGGSLQAAVTTKKQERVQKLRQEIAEIADANRRFVNLLFKSPVEATEQERRRQRLKEILDELRALTPWKET